MLTAALCCLMLYLFESMAMNRGFSAPIKEPNVPSATVSETTAVFLRSL